MASGQSVARVLATNDRAPTVLKSGSLRIISALQTREDTEALSIVRHLRDAQDPEAVARQLEGGDVLLQLCVHPETKLRFTFPFRWQMPEALRTPGNAYLKSPLFESAFLAPDRNAAVAATSLIETQQPQYFRPYAVAQIADSRITGAEFSHWTSVCTDDKLMRALLHVYLLTDYQTFSFFHKDFFLDDLNSRRPRFCSSLLVHAILAHLIHLPFPDRVEYWNPQSLGYKFFAEARRLWDMDRLEPDSVTTIQAGMIMNIIYNVYSMDKVGLSYGAQASAMAYKMGSVAIRADRAPPRPRHQSGMFKFDIWCILRPVAEELFNKEEKSDPATCRQTYTRAFEKMMSLYSALPPHLSPMQVVFPLHMGIHTWYHNIMSGICQLLISKLGDSTVSSLRLAAEAQLVHSKICFETILRLYYLRNGYDGGNMLLLHCLAVLSFNALAERQSPGTVTDLASQEDKRNTLILAAKGLHDQGKNYFMSATISRVLQSQMAPEDLDIVSQYCTSHSEQPTVQQARAEHVKAQYPLNIVNMSDVPEEQRLGNMIKQYEELAIQQVS
ncbi:Nitrogen assimilation transcription factor nirA [Beauveria bassiana]|uniref:Nitrogen assimilation transcription factor nirA n=1 Tax=Beauveria bassiana TaxID=176275 RepID=A0A2N6NTG9_BEABA|nr:Nitrogen assimilation transcription factor nirA [Beauveria bassiana]